MNSGRVPRPWSMVGGGALVVAGVILGVLGLAQAEPHPQLPTTPGPGERIAHGPDETPNAVPRQQVVATASDATLNGIPSAGEVERFRATYGQTPVGSVQGLGAASVATPPADRPNDALSGLNLTVPTNVVRRPGPIPTLAPLIVSPGPTRPSVLNSPEFVRELAGAGEVVSSATARRRLGEKIFTANRWEEALPDGRLRVVYAGEAWGSIGQQGMVAVALTDPQAFAQNQAITGAITYYRAPTGVGPLIILGADGERLTLQSTSETLFFDVPSVTYLSQDGAILPPAPEPTPSPTALPTPTPAPLSPTATSGVSSPARQAP